MAGAERYLKKAEMLRRRRELTEAGDFPSEPVLRRLLGMQERVTRESLLPDFWKMDSNNRRKRVDALYSRLTAAMKEHNALMKGYWEAPEEERGKLTYDITEQKRRLIFEYGIMMGFREVFPEVYNGLMADYGLTDGDVEDIRGMIFAMPGSAGTKPFIAEGRMIAP